MGISAIAYWQDTTHKAKLSVSDRHHLKLQMSAIAYAKLTIRPYIQVDAQFAYDEGESDRSLAAWREAHWQYFVRVLPKIGKKPSPEMLLVCERFRVVYKQHLINAMASDR